MNTYLTQADVRRAFEVMGVTPIERDIRQLRDLMAPASIEERSSGIEYRTVLANGTGKLPRTERTNAELERDAI